MRAKEEQLGIPGIGQQKMTIEKWKEENQINTHDHGVSDSEVGEIFRFNVWSGSLSIDEAQEKLGNGIGASDTAREAILDFCEKSGLKPPFWWDA